MASDGSWMALCYTLDEDCWGYIAEHAERGVYAFERGARLVVPSFHRFEHAALFVRQLAGHPELERGGSIDLAPVWAYATEALEVAPAGLEDAWWLLVDVALAADPAAALAYPSDGEAPRPALRECLAAFRSALLHLDGPG